MSKRLLSKQAIDIWDALSYSMIDDAFAMPWRVREVVDGD